MDLIEKIESRKARIGIIGLGYVGLPLVLRFCEEGFRVVGFDVDPKKVMLLDRGRSYIKYISSGKIKGFLSNNLFEATDEMKRIGEVDAIIICVPTPLTDKREPDMTYVEKTSREVARYLRRGQLVSLESTTYPGTTEEILLPLFVEKGFKAGTDFYLVYSSEREDPGRKDFTTSNTPKVVGGITPSCLKAGKVLYAQIVDTIVQVSSTRAAEMTKLLENIYRSVNISMVNELKILCSKMDIDIWEVVQAAKTKPFGFQAFYPGPGLGGHCIPIDPFYLTWKAREYDFATRFIELAGEINTNMPYYVVQQVVEALNDRNKSAKGARILLLGIAYKKDVDDTRESPALRIMKLLTEKGAKVEYNDPFVPLLKPTRKYTFRMKSVKLTGNRLKGYDCVLIITDHSAYDFDWILKHAELVVDTRNAIKKKSKKIIKA